MAVSTRMVYSGVEEQTIIIKTEMILFYSHLLGKKSLKLHTDNCCQDIWEYPKQMKEFVNLTNGQTWTQISQNTLTNVPLAKKKIPTS
jgi:hypothetical protein